MKLTIISAAILSLCVMGLSGPAWADMVVYQNTAANQTLVKDVSMHDASGYTNFGKGEGGSDSPTWTIRAFSTPGDPRFKALVAFQLGTLLTTPSGNITSATLSVYNIGGNNNGFPMAWRLKDQYWVQGTAGMGNSNNLINDGATGTYWNGIHVAASNLDNSNVSFAPGYTHAELVSIPAGLGADFDRAHSATSWGTWSSFADQGSVALNIAYVDANISTYYYDNDSGNLYFYPVRGRGSDVAYQGVGYYLNSDKWVGGYASSTNIDTSVSKTGVAGTGSWFDINVTDYLKTYLDSTHPTDFGVMLGGTGDRSYYDSEYPTDYTLGPKLTVEYTPEPATLALLAMGGVGVLIRRRRNRA